MPADRPVAVSTGVERCIGRQLADAGFLAALGSHSVAAGENAARRLDPTGRGVVACRLDVTDPSSGNAVSAIVEERCGRADVLVNNAAAVVGTAQGSSR